MNIFEKCKTIEELKQEYKREHYGCETFEWLGRIERDYKEKYLQLLAEGKTNESL